MSRTVVLAVSMLFIAVLAFLTLFVLLASGPDVLVVVSFVILALFGFGVIGALATPPDD